MKHSSFMSIGKEGLITRKPDPEVAGVPAGMICRIGENKVLPSFVPTAVLHSFYWPGIGNYGIPDSREISFTAVDPLRFQLAGYFEQDPFKPLYYISRETDDTCLSLTLGGLAYTKNHFSAYQQWLVSNLGENKYCLMLPVVPCRFFIRPFTQSKKRFLSVTRSKDVKNISSITLHINEIGHK